MLAVILGIVTLGTTFIDAHLTEIKDIAGDILQAYPMLLALVLFGTCALLYSQGATTPLIIPLAVALDVPTWAILASYVYRHRSICTANVSNITGCHGI